MSTSPAAAVLYAYPGQHGTRYGITREGAVLAAEPFCAHIESHLLLARLVFVTDHRTGGRETVEALGHLLGPGKTRDEHLPIVDALLFRKYATAVQLAGAAGVLK